ncbi:30S ribosomal protein S20 [soil metagenome]|nr:30S ribosomal protein S20 [Acidobacteriota bacterium]
MASHNSALKAHKQSIERRDQNRALRTRLRRALREIRAAIDTGEGDQVNQALRSTVSLVDRMAGKGIIHRNAAARYKSRLASRVAKKSAAA